MSLNCHLNDGQSVTFTTTTTPHPFLGFLKKTTLKLVSAPSNSGCYDKIGETKHTAEFTRPWGRTDQVILGVDQNGKIECRNSNSKPVITGKYTVTCQRQ